MKAGNGVGSSAAVQCDALHAGLDRTGVAPQIDARVPHRFQQEADLPHGKVRVRRGERVHCCKPDLRLRGVEQPAEELQDLGGLQARGLAPGRQAEREDQIEADRRIGLRVPAPHKRRQYELTGAVADPECMGRGSADLRSGIGEQVEYLRQNLFPSRSPAGVQEPLGDLPGLLRQPPHQFQHHATSGQQDVLARGQTHQKGQRGGRR